MERRGIELTNVFRGRDGALKRSDMDRVLELDEFFMAKECMLRGMGSLDCIASNLAPGCGDVSSPLDECDQMAPQLCDRFSMDVGSSPSISLSHNIGSPSAFSKHAGVT